MLLASRQTFLSHEKSVFKSCNRASQTLEQGMQTTQQLGMNDIPRPVIYDGHLTTSRDKKIPKGRKKLKIIRAMKTAPGMRQLH
jgi:hypothetical protein